MTLALCVVMESMTSSRGEVCMVGFSKNFHCSTYVPTCEVTCEPWNWNWN